jgi:fatty-acyl-CoA synthase
MDWDSHRYLEAFFAVPMMGAVLQTVNVRLSPEQILYTLNHARADVLLVNAEFVPMLAIIKDQLETVKRFILISDDGATLGSFGIPTPASTRPCWPRRRRTTTSRFRREHPRHHLLHHRHHRAAEGRVFQPPAAGAAHPGGGDGPRQRGRAGRVHRDDVYMPITPMFHVHAWGMPTWRPCSA